MTDRYQFWMYLGAVIATLAVAWVPLVFAIHEVAAAALGGVAALVGMWVGGSYGIRRG